jgi:hypothetical protein
LGRAFSEFKRATAEIKETMEFDKDITDIKKSFEDIDNHIQGQGPVKADYETANENIAVYPEEKITGVEDDTKEKAG